MKVLAIRLKRTIVAGGERYRRGDEAKLDAALDDDQKKKYAALGLITVVKKSPKPTKAKDDSERNV